MLIDILINGLLIAIVAVMFYVAIGLFRSAVSEWRNGSMARRQLRILRMEKILMDEGRHAECRSIEERQRDVDEALRRLR